MTKPEAGTKELRISVARVSLRAIIAEQVSCHTIGHFPQNDEKFVCFCLALK